MVNLHPSSTPLHGSLTPPGDKSISHRALMIAAAARGTSQILNLAPGADVRSSQTVLARLGVTITPTAGALQSVLVESEGMDGWREPSAVLDAGNSGTTIRLMAGLLATRPFLSILDGDDSLRARPMDRVTTPLRSMGAFISGRQGGLLAPLVIDGARRRTALRPFHGRTPVASAQVKSSLLLAALGAPGETFLLEELPTRDHTERMLAAGGVDCHFGPGWVRLNGPARPKPLQLTVPGDPSSAFPWAVLATLIPDSELQLRGVLLNRTRLGGFILLQKMGADIAWQVEEERAGEPVGSILVRAARLQGIRVEAADVPAAVDELPLLAVAATRARGETVVTKAGELRRKESDRIHTIAVELGRLGAAVEELPDGWRIDGAPHEGVVLDDLVLSAHGDHRVAMALAVAVWSGSGNRTCQLEEADSVRISYPDFFNEARNLGLPVAEAAEVDRHGS